MAFLLDDSLIDSSNWHNGRVPIDIYCTAGTTLAYIYHDDWFTIKSGTSAHVMLKVHANAQSNPRPCSNDVAPHARPCAVSSRAWTFDLLHEVQHGLRYPLIAVQSFLPYYDATPRRLHRAVSSRRRRWSAQKHVARVGQLQQLCAAR